MCDAGCAPVLTKVRAEPTTSSGQRSKLFPYILPDPFSARPDRAERATDALLCVKSDCTFQYNLKGKVMTDLQLAAPSRSTHKSRLDPYSDDALAEPWETHADLQNIGSAVWLEN